MKKNNRIKLCKVCGRGLRSRNKTLLCQTHYLTIYQMKKCKCNNHLTEEEYIKKCKEFMNKTKNNSNIYKEGLLR